MAGRSTRLQPIFDGAAANGVGIGHLVNDFQNLQLDFSTADSADLVFRIQGSFALERPDFSSAATTTNRWDYVDLWNYNDSRTVIVGSTGIVLNGTDVVQNLQVNVTGLRWINGEISSYVAGTVFAFIVPYNNQ